MNKIKSLFSVIQSYYHKPPKKYLVMALFSIVLTISALAIYFLSFEKGAPRNTNELTPTVTIPILTPVSTIPTVSVPTSTSIPFESVSWHPLSFDLKQLQTVFPQNLPTEITELQKRTTTLECTDKYDDLENGYFGRYVSGAGYINDPSILSILEQANAVVKRRDEDFTMASAEICRGKEGYEFIKFQSPDGWKTGNASVTNLAKLDGSGRMGEVFAMFGQNATYFGCQLMAYDLNEQVYLQCGGGDTITENASIFTANLETRSFEKVISCDLDNGSDINNPTYTCN